MLIRFVGSRRRILEHHYHQLVQLRALNKHNIPSFSIAITMDTRPEAQAQKLHRDDKNHHARHQKVDAYHANRDMLLGLFVPGCDTTREITTTRIVPGSHLWSDEQPDFGPNGDKGVNDTELKAGEAFIMLGSLYHGAGQYYKSLGNRMVHITFMCGGIYRQEVCLFPLAPINLLEYGS